MCGNLNKTKFTKMKSTNKMMNFFVNKSFLFKNKLFIIMIAYNLIISNGCDSDFQHNRGDRVGADASASTNVEDNEENTNDREDMGGGDAHPPQICPDISCPDLHIQIGSEHDGDGCETPICELDPFATGDEACGNIDVYTNYTYRQSVCAQEGLISAYDCTTSDCVTVVSDHACFSGQEIECIEAPRAWISDAWSVNPLNINETSDLLTRLIEHITAAQPYASIHAVLTDFTDAAAAERLKRLLFLKRTSRLLLVRPSPEVRARLTVHPLDTLTLEVTECAPEGCAPSVGGQEANFVLLSHTLTRDGDGELGGAVIHLSAPLSGVAGAPAWATLVARHGDDALYQAALLAWRELSEGRRASRAASPRVSGEAGDSLQLSLDLHGAARSAQAALASLEGCGVRDEAGANVWLATPRLTDEQGWLLDEVARLEANGCSVKVLVNELSAALAAALGARARLTDLTLDLSAITAVTRDARESPLHVVWSAPAGWLRAEGDYEGNVLRMWSEAQLLRYRAPLAALWEAGRAP